jgi:hypothetical protein
VRRFAVTVAELEVIAQALALWEATAPDDEQSEGDVSYADATRLRVACETAAAKVAILRARRRK